MNINAKKKVVKQSKKRNLINKMRKSRVKTFIKHFIAAVKESNFELAGSKLGIVQSEMMRSGVFHKNTIARKISRLNSMLVSMADKSSGSEKKQTS